MLSKTSCFIIQLQRLDHNASLRGIHRTQFTIERLSRTSQFRYPGHHLLLHRVFAVAYSLAPSCARGKLNPSASPSLQDHSPPPVGQLASCHQPSSPRSLLLHEVIFSDPASLSDWNQANASTLVHTHIGFHELPLVLASR